MVAKMIKILKIIRYNVLWFIVESAIFGSLGVYAASVMVNPNFGYKDNASLEKTNVQDTIDKLNIKVLTFD